MTTPIGSNAPAAIRRRAGDGAVFTSSKCPPGSGLEHSCELPFGFVWTPMSPSDSAAYIEHQQAESLPPVVCLTCLAYLNLYATFDATTGIWICPLCGERNAAPPEVFGLLELRDGASSQVAQAMVSPIVEYRQKIEASPQSSSSDDMSSSCNYILVLDGNLPKVEVQSVAKAIQSFLQDNTIHQHNAHQNIHIGLVVFTETVSVYQLGLSGVASADIHVPLWEEETDKDVLHRRNCMKRRSYLAPVRNSQQDLDSLWQCLSAVYGTTLHPDKVPDELKTSTTSVPLSRKEQLRLRKEARLRKQKYGGTNDHNDHNGSPKIQFAESLWVQKLNQKNKSSSHKFRCTAEAVQYAMDIAEFGLPHPPRTARVLLFTNGCSNMGLGNVVKVPPEPSQLTHDVDPVYLARAIQHFAEMARFAIEVGIGIDVFCTSAELLALPTYEALVGASGGYVLSHDSFNSPQFRNHINFVLSQTHVSRSSVGEEGMPNLNQLEGCLIDIRASTFMTATHVVGHGEILYEEPELISNERSAFAEGASLAALHGFRTNNLPSTDMLDTSLTRYRLGRYDPLTTLSVMLQVNDSLNPKDRYAFFQCIVRYVEPSGEAIVTRVCTHRLLVAHSIHDFLDGMDEEVVPVVLGKEAVYRSMVGRQEFKRIEESAIDIDRVEFLAYEVQSDLDATINKISGAFRLHGLEQGAKSRIGDLSEEGGIPTTRGSIDFAFPPELADALHRLYHLRRGPLLSPGPVQSLDDRAQKRSLFLHLPLDDCLCMMAPSLWSSTLYSMLNPIPSDTLALWSSCVIAADHHDGLFVWSGTATTGVEYDHIRQQCIDFLKERSYNRFPMPELHVLSEGDSMSRRITALLAPSHADPPEQQLVHFPALANLAPDDLAGLRDKFRFYDASSDASFRRWFWGVVSASSIARSEGMSLCQ